METDGRPFAELHAVTDQAGLPKGHGLDLSVLVAQADGVWHQPDRCGDCRFSDRHRRRVTVDTVGSVCPTCGPILQTNVSLWSAHLRQVIYLVDTAETALAHFRDSIAAADAGQLKPDRLMDVRAELQQLRRNIERARLTLVHPALEDVAEARAATARNAETDIDRVARGAAFRRCLLDQLAADLYGPAGTWIRRPTGQVLVTLINKHSDLDLQPTDRASAVLAAYATAQRPGGFALVCPTLAGHWLLRTAHRNTRIFLVDVTGVPEETLEVAVGLWDPHATTAMIDPAVCLDTAQQLLAP
jgi:hypothetical protein